MPQNTLQVEQEYSSSRVISELCRNYSKMSFGWCIKVLFSYDRNVIRLTWIHFCVLAVRHTDHQYNVPKQSTSREVLWKRDVINEVRSVLTQFVINAGNGMVLQLLVPTGLQVSPWLRGQSICFLGVWKCTIVCRCLLEINKSCREENMFMGYTSRIQ